MALAALMLFSLAGVGVLLGVRVVRLAVMQATHNAAERLGATAKVERVAVGWDHLRLEGLALVTERGEWVACGRANIGVDIPAAISGRRDPLWLTAAGVDLAFNITRHPEDLLSRGRALLARHAPAGAMPAETPPGGTHGASLLKRLSLFLTRLPPVDLYDARFSLLGDRGEARLVLELDRAALLPRVDEEGRTLEYALEAAGRVMGGGERIGWRFRMNLAAEGDYALELDFEQPFMVPPWMLSRLPERLRLTGLAMGGLRLDSEGAVHLRELQVGFGEPLPSSERALVELHLGVAKFEIDWEALPAARGELLETVLSGRGLKSSAVVLSDSTLRLAAPELSLDLPEVEVRWDMGPLQVFLLEPSLVAGLAWAGRDMRGLPAALDHAVSEARRGWRGDRVVFKEPEEPDPSSAAPDMTPPCDEDALWCSAAFSERLKRLRRLLVVQQENIAGLMGELESVAVSVFRGRLALLPEGGGDGGGLYLEDVDFALDALREGRARRADLVGRLRWGGDPAAHLALSAVVTPGGLPAVERLSLEGPLPARLGAELSDVLRLSPDAGGSLELVAPRLFSSLTGDESAEGRGRSPGLSLRGRFALHGIGGEHRMIARLPVEDVALAADFEFDWHEERRQAELTLDGLSAGNARFDVRLEAGRLGEEPTLSLDVAFPVQPCDGLLRDIPRGLIPRLEGARLRGRLWFDFKATVDLANPDSFRFHLGGDWSRCHAVTLGDHVSPARLRRSFVHQIWEGGVNTGIQVGPGTPGYVPLDQIPETVQQAALATEDMAFFRHEGFRPTLIGRAIRLNLNRRRYVYGGSTISQQLVKNLFLSREKTLSRKIEEAIITWHMERVLSKERILELYLNCIEYGPEIYGIRAAAESYFGVHPSDLSPLEGAFLMGLKPSPSSGYLAYRRRLFRPWWRQKMERILRRLWREMDVLTEAQYRAAAPYVPVFYYPGEGYVRPRAAGVPEEEEAPPDMPPMPPPSERQ